MPSRYSARSPKALRFVDEYLVDLCGAAAARRAGYAESRASRVGADLLKLPEIQAKIEAAKAKRAERTEVTQDYVLENLTEIVERCMQRAPVMVRRGRHLVQLTDDDDRHVWQFDATGAVKALALVAKHTGGFSDRVQVSGPNGGPLQYEDVTPEQRRQRLIGILRTAASRAPAGSN